MQTLLEVKNQIAQLYDYADWFQIDMTDQESCESNEFKASLIDEIATQYAEEACKEQRKICGKEVSEFKERSCVETAPLQSKEEIIRMFYPDSTMKFGSDELNLFNIAKIRVMMEIFAKQSIIDFIVFDRIRGLHYALTPEEKYQMYKSEK